MIKLNRILIPTDFSDFSKPAMTYACAMAARFESELHLLHVSPDAAMVMPDVTAYGIENMMVDVAAIEKSSMEQLQRLPPDNWENGREIVRVTKMGSPFLEIIQYAKDMDIDLIVIGTHGRSGLMHLLMGSVAENIVRKAPCPVLTVKPDGHQFVMP